MQQRTRKILFLICFCLFLSITPIAVFYSQGYRIDWETKKISLTGGLFLKIWPKQANIYLDSKFKKKTDFFFGSALIENLLPKKHKVLVKKEGFYPWEKTLEIKEKTVTTAENIILIPQKPNFTISTQDAEGFWFSPEEKEEPLALENFIFLKEGKALCLFNESSGVFEKFFEPIKDFKLSPDSKKLVYFSDYEIWILFLKEVKNPSSRRAGEKLFLLRLSEKIRDVSWLNSDYLIFTVSNKIKVSEIDTRDRINIVDLAEFENPEIFFNEKDKKLYILSNGNLYQSQALLP